VHKAKRSTHLVGELMDCTCENVGRLGLDEVVNAASAIYAKHDLHRSLWDVWAHALHHAAAVAEEIRKQPSDEVGGKKLRQEIADLALWLFTMLVKLKGPLGSPIQIDEVPQDWVVRVSARPSDLMWNRYPGVCPWCYCATHTDGSIQIDAADFWRPCDCDSLVIKGRKKEPEDLRKRAKWTRRAAAEYASLQPQSLDCWQDMIAALYGERLRHQSLAEVALHLIEEMGEVSDGLIRMYDYREGDLVENLIGARQIRLEDELADVLSWLFGFVERLSIEDRLKSQAIPSTTRQEASSDRLLLSQILWTKYGSEEKRTFWCRHCKNVACNCQILLIQSKQQVEDLLSKLKR
jgi:NTP pyrophosphatase (non-canonical NTP hydrolase)